jgi:hypothetical protein
MNMGWAAPMLADRLKPLLDFPQEWILPQWQHCGLFFARRFCAAFQGNAPQNSGNKTTEVGFIFKSPIFMGWANPMTVDRLKALLDFPQEWINPQWRHCGIFFARFFALDWTGAIPDVNNR